jgi:hypothetical protein
MSSTPATWASVEARSSEARPDSIFSTQLTVHPTRPASVSWVMPRRFL